MLYMSGEMSKPTRIQSPFISEEEVKEVVNYLADQYSEEPPDQIDFSSDEGPAAGISLGDESAGNDEEEDDMYEDARDLVIKSGKASTSFVQRKLRVGYARAARLMDMLEERGVVGPAEGSKPRQVLVRNEETEFGTDESAGFQSSAENEPSQEHGDNQSF